MKKQQLNLHILATDVDGMVNFADVYLVCAHQWRFLYYSYMSILVNH